MATAVFSENHDLITVPLVAKIGKRSNGHSHWRHVEKIFTKFKLLNVISVQFVDCNVCIFIYYGIAIHKLDRNYV